MKLTTLYSRSVNGKTNEFTIEIENNKYRTITGFIDGINKALDFAMKTAK